MALDDVWLISQEWDDGNESGVARGHYREMVGGEPDLENAGRQIVAHFHVAWRDLIAGETSVDATLVCTTAQRMTAPGSRIFTFFGAGDTGEISGPPIPAGLAVLFSKLTNINSRSTRGRMYLAFIAASKVLGGVVLDTAQAALNVLGEALLKEIRDVLSVGDMCGVVWSDKFKTSEDIANIELKPVLGSQTRRTNHHQPFAEDPV